MPGHRGRSTWGTGSRPSRASGWCRLAKDGGRFGRSSRRGRLGDMPRHTATRPAGPKARASSPFPESRTRPARTGAFRRESTASKGAEGAEVGLIRATAWDSASDARRGTGEATRACVPGGVPSSDGRAAAAPSRPADGDPTAQQTRRRGAVKHKAPAGGGRGRRVGRGGGHRLISTSRSTSVPRGNPAFFQVRLAARPIRTNCVCSLSPRRRQFRYRPFEFRFTAETRSTRRRARTRKTAHELTRMRHE